VLMKTIQGLLLLGSLSAGMFGTVWAQEAPDKARSALELVSKQTVDLGTLPAYGIKQVPFRFKNTGTVPVHIRKLIPTCSCVKGSAEKMEAQPNEEIEVMFNLDASMVHDAFKRGMWVETDARENPRIQLSVTGVIKPLFEGMPQLPITLVAADKNTVWTNRYTLTASETDLLLGAPRNVTNDMLHLTWSIATNRLEGKAEYALTLIATPQANGRGGASAVIPVISRQSGNQLHSLTFLVHANAGAELHVAPQRILLIKSPTPLVRKLRFRVSGGNVDLTKLTWTPQIKGVTVAVEPATAAFKSAFVVTVTIAPDVLEELLKAQETSLTFSYPDHNPVNVKLSPFVAPKLKDAKAAE